MALLTMNAALELYEQKLREAKQLLAEFMVVDCGAPWQLHEQHHEVAALTRLRDRLRVINDRLAEKHNKQKGIH